MNGNQYPSVLIEQAVEEISKLPGIGKKSALRLALHLLKRPEIQSVQLASSLVKLRTETKFCVQCHMISDEEMCGICASNKRDESMICVVEDAKDVLAIENTGQFNGLYHVLGGIISPMSGVSPSDLQIETLVNRVRSGTIQEIIVGLSPTMEGDTTAFYLTKKLKEFPIKISTIARGIPIGGDLEYTDEITFGEVLFPVLPMNKPTMKRAQFLRKTMGLVGASLVLPSAAKAMGVRPETTESLATAPFSLPNLGYDYKALEPSIDALTMEIHHSRHHKAYIDNLNKAIQESDMAGKSLEELLAAASKLPVAIRNNGGGHWNHSFFWKVIGPNKETKPSQALLSQILKDFGSLDNLKTAFTKAAMSRFGSGWAWLVFADHKLQIGTTANQDNPLMDLSDLKGKPIFALDVWEHAYYLKYQNKRADYVNAFWTVLNWDFASAQFTN